MRWCWDRHFNRWIEVKVLSESDDTVTIELTETLDDDLVAGRRFHVPRSELRP